MASASRSGSLDPPQQASSDSSEASSLDASFHCFPALPTELRLKIWEYAATFPQAIDFDYTKGTEPKRPRNVTYLTDPAPGPAKNPYRKVYWEKPAWNKFWEEEYMKTRMIEISQQNSLLTTCIDSRKIAMKDRAGYHCTLKRRDMLDLDEQGIARNFVRPLYFDSRQDAIVISNSDVLQDLAYWWDMSLEKREFRQPTLFSAITTLAIKGISLETFEGLNRVEDQGDDDPTSILPCEYRDILRYLTQFKNLEEVILFDPKVRGHPRFICNLATEIVVEETYFLPLDVEEERIEAFVEAFGARLRSDCVVRRTHRTKRSRNPIVTVMTNEEFRSRFSYYES
ncbi:hypothetical protein B0J14DRAFT_587217 [Halenospora varia]|nr:hypothetical protein B0J14DRAFT_587217 [Halenospora varia]